MISTGYEFSSEEQAALQVVSSEAIEVDKSATHPKRSVDALRSAGWLQPTQYSSRLEISKVAARCSAVGEACGSTGLIFAMHHVMQGCLARHTQSTIPEVQAAVEQGELIASCTTEKQTGGDISISKCAVERTGNGSATLIKDASVISYAEHAGLILVTARRDPQSVATDQVLVAVPRSSVRLTRERTWDGMGMRGTESHGYTLTASFPEHCIIPAPQQSILPQTMLPLSHLFWSATWRGITNRALRKTLKYLRSTKQLDSNAALLSRVQGNLAIWDALQEGAVAKISEPKGGTVASQASSTAYFNTLKIFASDTAKSSVLTCLEMGGFSAYSQSSSNSVVLELRDVLSASLMVANKRLESDMARTLPIRAR